MAFIESPRFPDRIAFGAVGGPVFSTDVAKGAAGGEQRNGNWEYPKHEWDVSQGIKSSSDFLALRAFFYTARGRLYGWRYRDWTDYAVSLTEGVIAMPGMPTGQLHKRYTIGTLPLDRKIAKPVAGTVIVKNGAATLTAGAHYTLDTATGLVTWVAAATGNVTAVTVGATTQVTLNAALASVGVGDKLYLSSLGGADAALLNGQAHTISAVAGAVYTLPVATTGKTITAAGTGAVYPGGKAADAIAWRGEFDVPMRFDIDAMQGRIVSRNASGLVYGWDNIRIVEVPA